MSSLVIGKSSGKNVRINIVDLLRQKLLLQANTGGGKSWAIRRIAEETHRKVQVIIVDPEGEFASLREKFKFVLVGPGGETPADVRSAEMLAHKLLEYNVSAVCDLYEMKEHQKHEWVKVFVNSLVSSPKKLWHDCMVIIDEAHEFCPEKGTGESMAMGAINALSSKGRKRGFGVVLATQRLSKLNKNSAATCQNVLIGHTFFEDDAQRAGRTLGVPRTKASMHDFVEKIKMLEPGEFYGFGRAISKTRILVRIGDVKTTHVEAGGGKRYRKGPPPPPRALQNLLPKLSDLPQEAEEKARTVGELRKEVRSLKQQLRMAKKASRQTAKPQVETVVRTETLVGKLDLREVGQKVDNVRGFLLRTMGAVDGLEKHVKRLLDRKTPTVVETRSKLKPSRTKPSEPQITHSYPTPGGDNSTFESLSKSQQKILKSLVEFHAIGQTVVDKGTIAIRSGARPTSGGYANNLSKLKIAGLIHYPLPGKLSITADGLECAPPVDEAISTDEMFVSAIGLMNSSQERIFRELHRIHPEYIGKSELAESLGIRPTSGGYANNLSKMKVAGFIEYGPNRTVKCSDWLFVEA